MNKIKKKNSKIVLFSGSAHQDLSKEIARLLKTKLIKSETKNFADGEIYIQLKESFRGDELFIIQPTCNPVNNNLMELLLAIDAAKRGSADNVIAIIPYFGYARQDRKDKPRVPISAKLVANLLTQAGADRIVTLDLHTGQLQGFFDIPVDHLSAKYIIADYFSKKVKKNKTVVVSPDAGGVERAREFARCLHLPIAIIDKRRPEQNKAEIMNIIGDIEGKTAILFDDMIDTAGTVSKAADALIKKGATSVYVAATHGVLSGNAITNITNSKIKEVVVTNTIPNHTKCKKIKVLSVAGLIAGAIKCIHTRTTMKILFK